MCIVHGTRSARSGRITCRHSRPLHLPRRSGYRSNKFISNSHAERIDMPQTERLHVAFLCCTRFRRLSLTFSINRFARGDITRGIGKTCSHKRRSRNTTGRLPVEILVEILTGVRCTQAQSCWSCANLGPPCSGNLSKVPVARSFPHAFYPCALAEFICQCIVCRCHLPRASGSQQAETS